MEARPFLGKTPKPENAGIKSVLAGVFPCYCLLMDKTAAFAKEWNHSKSGGWMQKIFDNKKALLYLIPLRGEFLISMTIRENERELLLKDKEIKSYKDELKQAKKYSEGYAMRFSVADAAGFQKTLSFINKMIDLRK